MVDRMSHYRGYFMKDGRIVSPAIIEAADDAQAMLKAGELLSTSQFFRIEVWQETRVVGALSAPVPSREFVGTLDKDFHSSEEGASNMSGQEEQDRDARIRRRAYEMWEAEGRPEGQADRHWSRAAEDLDREDAAIQREGIAGEKRGVRPKGDADFVRDKS